MKKRLVALLTGALATAGLLVAGAPAASAAPCGGTYTIAVGGFNDPTSGIFSGNVSQRVGYSAALNSASAREGVNELNRLIRNQRNACPGQHAKVVGFSEGAAVAHIWVTENWQSFGNVNAVLIADPKRAGGPGAAGLAGQWYSGIVGPPLAGADDFFGNVPTLTLCTDDIICDSTAASGWLGYPGKHMNYDFNVDAYSDHANGQWFNGVFIPR
ncbi:cutinase family protein [Amycolatopsis magusensis]|uniref:Cutinase n=1 Tax=Amycolatopsis magusensis TaxID=882444 RepID=A0ABS4PS21_9PSEU|nr:cutinase family protein [Amycolatopsis magusensis]MBP2181700.1 cutinase [Amycolatopsis magusensis]